MKNQHASSGFDAPKEIGIGNLKQASDLGEFEYNYISNLMHDVTGVFLDKHKIPMIQVRLARRIADLKLDGFRSYISYLRSHEEEKEHLINSLTTHKTDFFREPEHFEYLTKVVLPYIVQNDHQKKLRVWSAASSSGEEAYTLAIVLKEFFDSAPEISGWDYKILGTDIDTSVVAKASNGVYSSEVVRTIRPDLVQKYFQRGTGKNSGLYKVSPEISQIVKFRTHNLLEDLSDFGDLRFHVTFLRNVLIYFKDETREIVIKRMWQSLKPHGYLFVGHSEPLQGIDHQFKNVKASIYLKERV
jgi:chemotaxis protein methyltransferase CheR